MRSIRFVAASILLTFAMASRADIIWDFGYAGASGEITTTGDYSDVLALEGNPGSLDFNLLTFQFTESREPNLPIGDVWTFSGGSLSTNWELFQEYVYFVQFDATTDLTFPINVLGTDLDFTATQRLSWDLNPFLPKDRSTYLRLDSCAVDTEFFLNNGIAPGSQFDAGCNDSLFRQPSLLDIAPRGNLVSSVPEPSSLALLGIAALVLVRRRKS